MEEEQIIAEIAKHYESIISLLGDNPGRPGLEKTPMRAAKALYYATQGYRQDAAATIKSAIFDYAGSRMVIVKDRILFILRASHTAIFRKSVYRIYP